MRKILLNKILLSFVFMPFFIPVVSAAPILTGALFYASDSIGNGTIFAFGDTLGSNVANNLYLATSNPPTSNFINSGDSSSTNLNFALPGGTNDYFIFAERASALSLSSYWALNLYFDGDNDNPGISAVFNVASNVFVGGGTGNSTRALDGTTGFNAGGLNHTALDGTIITLTTMTVGEGSGDFVSAISLGSDGANDLLIQTTLSVGGNAIPEPQTLLLLVLGLMGMRRFALGYKEKAFESGLAFFLKSR